MAMFRRCKTAGMEDTETGDAQAKKVVVSWGYLYGSNMLRKSVADRRRERLCCRSAQIARSLANACTYTGSKPERNAQKHIFMATSTPLTLKGRLRPSLTDQCLPHLLDALDLRSADLLHSEGSMCSSRVITYWQGRQGQRVFVRLRLLPAIELALWSAEIGSGKRHAQRRLSLSEGWRAAIIWRLATEAHHLLQRHGRVGVR